MRYIAKKNGLSKKLEEPVASAEAEKTQLSACELSRK